MESHDTTSPVLPWYCHERIARISPSPVEGRLQLVSSGPVSAASTGSSTICSVPYRRQTHPQTLLIIKPCQSTILASFPFRTILSDEPLCASSSPPMVPLLVRSESQVARRNLPDSAIDPFFSSDTMHPSSPTIATSHTSCALWCMAMSADTIMQQQCSVR